MGNVGLVELETEFGNGKMDESVLVGLETIPLANGTGHEEKLGSGGGIAPDAMLYLRKSPYGKGWHYVEYERSARGRSRVSGKLRGYSSSRRRDSYPVILVVGQLSQSVIGRLKDRRR